MENWFKVLANNPLFREVEEQEMAPLLSCLGAEVKTYGKNTFVFAAGQAVKYVGVVLSGAVHILQEDYWGNRTIIAHLGASQLFGEAFVIAQAKHLPVSAIAIEKSEIMFLDYNKVINTCPSTCAFHGRLAHNMLRVLALKNMELTLKIEHVTRHSTREKLLSYFSYQAKKAGSASFEIPFNREELAEYLAVDRSALSAELSRMQKEGILNYKKNSFTLLEP